MIMFEKFSLNALKYAGKKLFPDDIFRDKIRPPRIFCGYRV